MRYWMNNERDKEPEIFDAEVKRVCEHYTDALRLYEKGAHLLSTDEKSSIQALERLHPSLPMRAGTIERQEHEYKRHGTRCLFANFEVATGKIIAPSIGPTRTNEDFAAHIQKTIATDPEGEWIFVVDQLNIHQSEALVKLVAKECSIEVELDGKGNLGHMKARWPRGALFFRTQLTGYALSTHQNTHLVAQPSGVVVFHPGASAAKARELRLGGRVAPADR
jgi:hypothetical protein